MPPADRGQPASCSAATRAAPARGGPGYRSREENLGAPLPARAPSRWPRARAGVDRQPFFLVYGDTALPPEYTVVGKITKGLDVLDKIAKGGVGEADENGNTPPKTSVQIEDLSTAPS